MPKLFESDPNTTYKMGDIVWVHVKGFPWWPGQMMDVSQANERILQDRQPHALLVSTFADGQYCWALPANIRKFHERNPQTVKKSTLAARLQQAVEEAKEVMATRRGKTPATDHQPLDFLNPPEGASIKVVDEKPQEAGYSLAPGPLTPKACAAVEPAAVLEQLRLLAGSPEHEWEGRSPASFLYAWRQANYNTSKGGRRGGSARRKSESVQREATPALATKKKRKRALSKAAAREEEREEEVEEEEEEDVVEDTGEEEAEEAISDMDPAEQSEGNDSDAHEAGDKEEAEEVKRKFKKQKKATRKKPAKAAKEEEEEEEEAEEEEEGEPEQEAMWEVLQRADLQAALNFLKRMAVPRTADGIGRMTFPSYASARAALLLVREQQYSRSSLQREGQIGYLATLAAKEAIVYARKQSRKPPKAGKPAKAAAGGSGGGGSRPVQGIPVEVPEIGDTATLKQYADRVPLDPQEFQQSLEAFYNSHGKSLTAPVVGREPLDMYAIFKAVATLGGYQSVTFNREWQAVAKKWRDDLSVGGRAVIPKKYVQYLLAYEDHISEGASQRELSRAPARVPKAAPPLAAKAKAGGSKGGRKRERSPDLMDEEAGEEQEGVAEPLLNYSDDDDDFKPNANSKALKTGAGKKVKRASQSNAKVSELKVKKKRVENVDFSALAEEGQTAKKEKPKKAEPVQTSEAASPKPPKPQLSDRPLAEQRRVLRLRFSQGIDMPSRGKLSLEMKKHGEVEKVETVSKANTCSYTFTNETYAAAALAAITQKLPVSWNVPKGSMTATQELCRPAPVHRGPGEAGPSSMASMFTGPTSAGRVPGVRPASGSEAAVKASSAPGAATKVAYDPRSAAFAPGPGHSQAVASHSAHPVDPRQQPQQAQPQQQQRHSWAPPQDPRSNLYRPAPGPAAFYPVPQSQAPIFGDPRQQYAAPQGLQQQPQGWGMQMPPEAQQQSGLQAHPYTSSAEPARGNGFPPASLPDLSALASIMQNVEAQSGAAARQSQQPAAMPDLQAILQNVGMKPSLPHSQGSAALPSSQPSGPPVDPRIAQNGAGHGMEAPRLAGDEAPDVRSSMTELMRSFM